MLSFPNAKINLGLSILRKRADGYHDLETIFAPIAWCDALEFVPAEKSQLHVEGISVTQHPESNLVWKAYLLMQARFPSLPPLTIHLLKQIPHGAGLGGGSADAAFMLKALNAYFQLNLSSTELISMALNLGSDCPFFIYNQPCFAHGRGEHLEPIELDLSNWQIALVKPAFAIPTALAFQGIVPKTPEYPIRDIIQQPIETWRGCLVNDFEAPLIQSFPDIQWIRDSLYDFGCIYAALSGSGSTVYGLFKQSQENEIALGLTELHKKIRDLRVHVTDFTV